MLIVETIAKIRRLHFTEGKGIKTICRDLKLSMLEAHCAIGSSDALRGTEGDPHRDYRVHLYPEGAAAPEAGCLVAVWTCTGFVPVF